jgi:hypothetical protein
MPSKFKCSHCGKEHDGLPTDWAYKLPDEVHDLSYLDRYARSRHNSDLCTLDESRYFIRTLLCLPLTQGTGDQTFNWGVWVEVDKETHDLYLSSWNEDISARPRANGRIANAITVYGDTLDLPVEIQFQSGTDRPTVQLTPGTSHALALEQARGISGKRHHDILFALGHFDEGDA